MKIRFAAAAVAIVWSLSVGSANAKDEPAINADTKDSFATVSTWVRKEMDDGGRYGHVTDSERRTVETKLDEMGALLEKHGAVAQMGEDDKMRMFNDQEQVNSILAKRDGDRLVCKSVAPVGSHIPVKTCKTARQMEQEQKESRKFLDDRSFVTQKRGGQ